MSFWKRFVLVLTANEFVVALMGLLSWWTGCFSKGQMKWVMESGNTENFMPFIFHGGAIGDFFLLSWILAIILGRRYYRQWSKKLIGCFSLISAAGMLGMNLAYLSMTVRVPNFTAVAGHMTPAGWVHGVYSAVTFPIFFLFFFASQSVKRKDTLWILLGGLPYLALAFVEPAWYIGDSLLNPALMFALVAPSAIVIAGSIRLYFFRCERNLKQSRGA